MGVKLRARLSADPQQVARARVLLASWLTDWGVEEGTGEVVVLLTSELVTNAILHGSPPVELIAFPVGDRVRVEVHDNRTGKINDPKPVDGDSLGGRGLHLVQALATRWGSDELKAGKSVWFEVAS